MTLPASAPPDATPLRCWREGGIAHLRFNRPQAMNAIDLPMAPGAPPSTDVLCDTIGQLCARYLNTQA